MNQIRLRAPLEIQTIEPKTYLKSANELGYDGQMLPVIELQSHSSHIDILRDNSIYDYSYTYNILSH